MSSAPGSAGSPPARPPAPIPATPQRRRTLWLMAIVFAALALAALGYEHFVGQFEVRTDNAYVGGSLIQVHAQVAGTVTALYADDTQRVRQGQTLVQLDAADAQIAVARAEADLAEAVRGVRGLFVGRTQAQVAIQQRQGELARARAEVDRAGIELARARDDHRRRVALAADRAIAAEELEHARQAVDTAQSGLAAALATRDGAIGAVRQAEQQLAAATVPIDKLTLDAHPRVAQASSRLKDAYLARARTAILAPSDGTVVRRSVQVGQRIAAGAPLLAIVPLERVWVDANFKEVQLEHLRVGQRATLRADAYPGLRFQGRVAGLGAGTGSVLSLLPPQNATGNWIKVVQRVPVRIVLDPPTADTPPLRLGLSMTVTVDVRDRSGPILPPVAEPQPVQSTDVFDAQSRQADAAIARIIAEHRE